MGDVSHLISHGIASVDARLGKVKEAHETESSSVKPEEASGGLAMTLEEVENHREAGLPPSTAV
jgi:hypothetical protein